MLVLYFALISILANGCLAAETRISGGEPAEPHQFPYHVAIFWKSRIPAIRPHIYCGGAIISDRWVLTAAHCITRFGKMIVKAGKHVILDDESYQQVRYVSRYIIHPHYKRPTIPKRLFAENDIALLEVDLAFNFNDYVKSAQVHDSSTYFQSGSLAGWGSIGQGFIPNFPDELHYHKNLPVIDQKSCADAINQAIFEIKPLPIDLNDNQVCSGPIGEGSGACLFDGGSAFVQITDYSYNIIGIVSWYHVPCGSLPTVFTRVGAYYEWIHEIIGIKA